MGKNLVVCSDGTFNKGGVGRETNVWRIYNLVSRSDSRAEQLTVYDDGVGTESLKLLKLLGGAFGMGLSQNIRDLYEFLVRQYEPGDSIFLFGFSRGAFTVRSLSGLIATCGIVDMKRVTGGETPTDEDVRSAVRQAFYAYRFDHVQQRRALQWKRVPFAGRARSLFAREDGASLCSAFRKRFSHEDNTIRFVGVWDTVRALGGPFDGWRTAMDAIWCFDFHKSDLAPNVEYGCHALAIDEERRTFRPLMWDEAATNDGDPERVTTEVDQVWFSGVHSNVGGGYPKQGLSHASLYWMMTKAEAAGLHFPPSAFDAVRSQINPHGKMYDSRAGFAAYYRYLPRRIHELGRKHGIGRPRVHASALERVRHATAGYAPGNLPRDFEVVTSTRAAPPAGAAATDASEPPAEVAGGDPGADPGADSGTPPAGVPAAGPIAQVARLVTVREWVHGAMLAVTVAAAGAALSLPTESEEPASGGEENTGSLACGAKAAWTVAEAVNPLPAAKPVLGRVSDATQASPAWFWGPLLGVVVILAVGRWCTARMQGVFRRYWDQRFTYRGHGCDGGSGDGKTAPTKARSLATVPLPVRKRMLAAALMFFVPIAAIAVGGGLLRLVDARDIAVPCVVDVAAHGDVAGDVPPHRLCLGYGKAEFTEYLKARGEEGRRDYFWFNVADLLFPLLYGAGIAVALHIGLAQWPNVTLRWGAAVQLVAVLPLAVMCADWIENGLLLWQQSAFDDGAMDACAVRLAGVATSAKFLLMGGNFVLLALLALRTLVKGATPESGSSEPAPGW